MPNVSSDLYLLAVIPPQGVIDFIEPYRQQYAKYTSYIIPPHITICPPFYRQISEQKLISRLKSTFANKISFTIFLNSVGYFIGKNNVVFFQPDPISTVSLIKILKTIQTNFSHLITNVWSDYPTDPEKFIPHLTIAEHIPESDFTTIKKYFSALFIGQHFIVNSIFLVKKINKDWLPVAEI